MKNLRLILLVVVFATAFFSCSKDAPDANTIKFWHFWSEPNQQKAIRELIAEFEKEHNCKVEITELSWNDGKTKLFAAFNSNTAPDVLELGSDWVAQFSSSGVLAELNADSMEIFKFIDYSLDPSFWDGKLFAIPWIVNTRVLFYNKSLLEKAGSKPIAPKTLEEMLELAERINSIDGCYGFGANGSDPHRLYKKIITFMWTLGGQVFDENKNLVLNSNENVNAYEYYLQLSRVGIIETQKKIDDLFARGSVGLWLSGTWLLEKIKNQNPDLNFAVALIPGVDAENPGISFAGGEYLAINAKSANPELAQKFVKFITDGVNALEFCKMVAEAGFPADKNYYNDPYYQTMDFLPVFAEQLKYSKMTPVHPKWLDIELAIENALVEALYGRRSAREALNLCQEDLLKLLK